MDGFFKPIGNLANELNWNLRIRQLYQTQPVGDGNAYIPIPPFSYDTSVNCLLIGAENFNAPPSWTLGCWCSVNLQIRPDSQAFGEPLAEIARHPIPLNQYKLIWFPEFTPKPYTLRFNVPRWHTRLLIEIWELDPAVTPLTSDLQQMLSQLNATINPPP